MDKWPLSGQQGGVGYWVGTDIVRRGQKSIVATKPRAWLNSSA